MLPEVSIFELERSVASEFEVPDDPELDSEEQVAAPPATEVEAADWEESFSEGAFGFCAVVRRKLHDEDDDSDFVFDDSDDDEDLDEDEDEDLDDDFDDEDASDDFDDGVDEREDDDEP